MRFPNTLTFVQRLSDLPIINLDSAFLEICLSYFIADKNEEK